MSPAPILDPGALPDLGTYAGDHPPATAITVLVSVAVLVALYRIARQITRHLTAAFTRAADRTGDGADLLTYAAASIATTVAGQGMWRFFRDVLHVEPFLRVGMFGFVELAVLTSAVRARQQMRENGAAGVDGAAVWALTSLSACLSAMDARSIPEAIFRLAAPLVAAWLWERGLHVERARRTGRTGIHWTLTPERVLVRLGVAEPTDRSSGQAAVDRYLTRLALAAKHARTTTNDSRSRRRAMRRLDTAMRQAITHTDLPTNHTQQQQLLAQLAALTTAASLTTITAPAPWDAARPPATGSAHESIGASNDPIAVDPIAVDPIAVGPIDLDPTRADPILSDLDRIAPEPIEVVDVMVSPTADHHDRRDGGRFAARADRGEVHPSAARQSDLDRARKAIAQRQLPPAPSAEAIRTALAISPAYARAVRDALRTHRPATPPQTSYDHQLDQQHPSIEKHHQQPPNSNSSTTEEDQNSTTTAPSKEAMPAPQT